MNGSTLRYGIELREEACAWSVAVCTVCALAGMIVLLVAMICAMVEGFDRERVEWMDGGGRSYSGALSNYPDPVCPWCGGIMDGHGCQCQAMGLPVNKED